MNNGGRFEKELESPGIYNRKEGENWKAKLKGNRCQKGLLDQESPLDSILPLGDPEPPFSRVRFPTQESNWGFLHCR